MSENKDLQVRVEEIMADLAKRGTRLVEKPNNGSGVAERDSGRGLGYREAARTLAQVLAATETKPCLPHGPRCHCNEEAKRTLHVEQCPDTQTEYEYQIFDTKRSRKVMDIPTEDVPEIEEDMKNPSTPAHWVLRRRVVGEWEDVK